VKWNKTTCNHGDCEKPVMTGKYFCNKHVHGQRNSNPVSGTGSSYGTLKNKYHGKKKKKNSTANGY